jgi:hypothetical protein
MSLACNSRSAISSELKNQVIIFGLADFRNVDSLWMTGTNSTASNCQSPNYNNFNYNKKLNDPANNKGRGQRAETLPQCGRFWASNNQAKRLGQPTNPAIATYEKLWNLYPSWNRKSISSTEQLYR